LNDIIKSNQIIEKEIGIQNNLSISVEERNAPDTNDNSKFNDIIYYDSNINFSSNINEGCI